VRNISRGGINLVLSRSFRPGELLSVALPGNGEDTEVLACVMRCDEVAGAWQLGCTFATQLSDDDLRRFGARAARTSPPDQRTWERFPCQAQAAFTVVRSKEPAARPVSVVNISAGGIALQVTSPLSIGELLSVELRRSEGQPVLTTLASVVRTTTERTGGHIVGCNFIHHLPEEQIRQLL
jgi:hypothetical protein